MKNESIVYRDSVYRARLAQLNARRLNYRFPFLRNEKSSRENADRGRS